jgi:hypothetical protein
MILIELLAERVGFEPGWLVENRELAENSRLTKRTIL